MHADFWHARWTSNETGFHQHAVNPYLQMFWRHVAPARGDAVFVPLCGKSLDMLWLADQGWRVVGVELSPIAVNAFFEENGLQAVSGCEDGLAYREHGAIRIFCTDYFDLTPACISNAATVYDRASLIALPPDMRPRYVQHLAGLLSPGARVLLITMEYPQEEMQGPPFAVKEDEVRELYKKEFDIERLLQRDILAENPRFQTRGLSRLEEKVYLLVRR